jgi:uncharacterized membrane protein YfcA
MDLLLIASGGLLAGFVGALMGVGGGIVAVPFLNLVVGIPIHSAAAAGLISTLSVSCAAAGRYLRQGELVDIHMALRLELFAAAGGLFGGIAVGWLRGPVVQLLFAVTLVYACIHIVRSALKSGGDTGASGSASRPVRCRDDINHRIRTLATFFLCLLAGILSGLLGIGGGIVVVPVLHLVLYLPFKNATATSNFMMGLTAVPALCGFVSRGDLDLYVAAPLAAGVLLGASVGARIMPRIKTPVLKMGFAVLLALAAFEMARKGMVSW